MTIARRPSPFGELMTLRQAMDRLFDDDYRPFRWTSGAFDGPALPLDVTTSDDALTIEAALPGIKPEDVDITVENGTVRISGKTAPGQPAPPGEAAPPEGGGGFLGTLGGLLGGMFGTNNKRGQRLSPGQIVARSVARGIGSEVARELSKSLGGGTTGRVTGQIIRGTLGGILRR